MLQLSVSEALALIPNFNGSSAKVVEFMSSCKRECFRLPLMKQVTFLLFVRNKFEECAWEAIKNLNFVNVQNFETAMKSLFVPQSLLNDWKTISKQTDELVIKWSYIKPVLSGDSSLITSLFNENTLEIEQSALVVEPPETKNSGAHFNRSTRTVGGTEIGRLDEQRVLAKTKCPVSSIEDIEILEIGKIWDVERGNTGEFPVQIKLLYSPGSKDVFKLLDSEYCSQPRVQENLNGNYNFSRNFDNPTIFAHSTQVKCVIVIEFLINYVKLMLMTTMKCSSFRVLNFEVDRSKVRLKVPPDKVSLWTD